MDGKGYTTPPTAPAYEARSADLSPMEHATAPQPDRRSPIPDAKGHGRQTPRHSRSAAAAPSPHSCRAMELEGKYAATAGIGATPLRRPRRSKPWATRTPPTPPPSRRVYAADGSPTAPGAREPEAAQRTATLGTRSCRQTSSWGHELPAHGRIDKEAEAEAAAGGASASGGERR
ncbi:hypothetical protein ZWY2020_027343 [Hordeum vulgare]|nr:hypothetical protein ZWY2020_027343 [Hordeum vulgare]